MITIQTSDIERITNLANKQEPLDIKYLDDIYDIPKGFSHDNYYRFMYLLIKEFKPRIAVELGTQYSRCTVHLAAGCADTKIYTVDHADCYNEEIIKTYPNINYIRSGSTCQETINKFDDKSIDIMFVDSYHQTGHVLNEIKTWSKKTSKNCVWIFDDLWMMDDLFDLLPFKIKGKLPGLHTVMNGEPAVRKDCLMAFGLNTTTIYDLLSSRFDTDKHQPDFHTYGNVYDELLEPYKKSTNNILELGVGSGGSICVWHEIFQNSMIYGIDNINLPEPVLSLQRFKYIKNDVYNTETLNVFKDIKMSIIIDDCLHTSEHQIEAYDLWSSILEKDGIYIIEDIRNINEFTKLWGARKKFEVFSWPEIKTRYNDNVLVVLRR